MRVHAAAGLLPSQRELQGSAAVQQAARDPPRAEDTAAADAADALPAVPGDQGAGHRLAAAAGAEAPALDARCAAEAEAEGHFVLDIGCGSGLSGAVLSR